MKTGNSAQVKLAEDLPRSVEGYMEIIKIIVWKPATLTLSDMGAGGWLH